MLTAAKTKTKIKVKTMTNFSINNKICKGLFIGLTLSALISCGGTGGSSDSVSSVQQSSSQQQSSSSSTPSSSAAQSSSAPAVVQELSFQENDTAICTLEGVVETEHGGATGSGYINTDNTNSAGLSFHLSAAESLQGTATIRYANGSDTARSFEILNNGAAAATASFASTGAWDSWQELDVNIALNEGSNLIQLLPQSDGGLANIDVISMTELGIAKGNCAVATISASQSVAALNQSVQFTAQRLTANTGVIDYYQWYFDGLAGDTGQSVSYGFDSLGEHEVLLETVDVAGNTSSAVFTISIVEDFLPLTIYIAGDSTVSTYADSGGTRDQAGWGQMLQESFAANARVDNRAIGGRTARRFIDEGRLDAIWNDAQAGDYLLVQFGTNDGHPSATYTINGQTIPYYLDPATDFKTWLQRYVDGARARDINLIFVTPPPRNSAYCTGGNGTGAHAQGMREFAAAQGVPLVDLNLMVVTYLTNICPSPTPEDFFFVRADGSVDGTHFQENGARIMSQMIAGAIKDLGIGLAGYLN